MRKLLLLLFFTCVITESLLAQVTINPQLKEALQTAVAPVQVVVTFQGNGAPQAFQVSLLQQLGITKGITMQSLPIAGVLATAAQVEALAKRPEVKSIYLNKQLTYYNFDGGQLTGVKRLRTDKNITAKNNGLPLSGKGVGVLINDSGVDGTHDDIKFGAHLIQNVMGSTNLNALSTLLPVSYLENVPNTDTNSGHGTHCAGTVGGNGAKSGGKYEGVAPGANLLGYGSGAALFILDAIGGYDYALTHQFQYGIQVISNSWGTSGDFDPMDPVNIVSKKAYDRGIVSVFAAGNDGPGSDTHNPYAIAPWVISVGAGDKFGKLADFSSRGVKGEKGTFTIDGESWTFENRPSIVAPGVDIVSTRALAPVSSLSAEMDAAQLEPAHVPFYTHMSGTSMATPHVAGIVALMLEAKPSLSPAEVKQILEKTATNIPNRESWEVGAGYVNAYAAIDQIYRSGAAYGSTLNFTRNFTSSVNAQNTTTPFSINFNPLLTAGNQITFDVADGTTGIEAKVNGTGILGQTGNPVNLILLDPDGTQYRSGIPVAFALYYDRSVAVASPKPGIWTLKVEGLQGVALPETIAGTLTQQVITGTTGLADISGHPAEASIKMAVGARLVDGISGSFKPDDVLKRIQLADYLLMGQGIRQFLPVTGAQTYSDLKANELLLAESVSATGAAIKDREHKFAGVMVPAAAGKFAPTGNVNRVSLAYSLVQSLGLQEAALARNGKKVTVTVDGKTIPIDDAAQIPAGLEGYVSVALELNLINAYYSLSQGPLDLFPTLHATFKPLQNVTRAEFAVIITRTFTQWDAGTQPALTSQRKPADSLVPAAMAKTDFVYPNPFAGSTTINYVLPEDGFVTVEVYDQVGKKVNTLVSETKAAGQHQINFDGSNLANGVYLYKVKSGDKVSAKRMVIKH